MDKNLGPDDPDDDELPPADGPLTRLVEEQIERSQPQPLESELPRQPQVKHGGRDDYAIGTSEHDDDRET